MSCQPLPVRQNTFSEVYENVGIFEGLSSLALELDICSTFNGVMRINNCIGQFKIGALSLAPLPPSLMPLPAYPSEALLLPVAL